MKKSAAGALTLLIAATCAAETPRAVIVLWSADDQWVKIVPQDDPAAPPNEHPAQLATDAISSALAALQVRIVDEDTGTETRRAVFTREELHNLAPRVASGLAQAGPRQDVTFSTIGSHPLAGSGLIKAVGVNAGRVFYDSGRLNVIFGELQSSYRKKNLYGQRSEDFVPRRQGSRDRAAEQKLSLAPRAGVEFRSIDGAVRNDWIAIDSAVAAAPVAAGPAPAAGANEAPSAPARKSSSDVEQRLRTLKDLKDQGLISEEAYRAKMQEVLSEL
jgi:hypothetical protein